MGKPEEKETDHIKHNQYELAWREGWNAACESWEEWEAERPGRWLRLDSSELWADAIACNNCGFMDVAAELSECHATCPGCGRKMEG